MIKVVTLIRCKCEDCGQTVNEADKFCSECGCKLTDKVTYEEMKGTNIR